jgi:hypothetical protein
LRLWRFYNRCAGLLSHDHSRSGKPIAICTACARLWLERHGLSHALLRIALRGAEAPLFHEPISYL